MAVCTVILAAVLFYHVPPEYVQKTVAYAARDIISPGGDIVVVYPSLSSLAGPVRFNLTSEGETYKVSYTWSYERQPHSYQVEIPKELFEFYQNKTHDRRDYAQYAVSEYDRELIQDLAKAFSEHGKKNKYSEDQIALNIISFVHTIPYTYDIDTTGQIEYPRYPVETLVEGGDCEDRAILAAAIMYELGIDCILIHMEDHMALGLKDNGNFSGQSYMYDGTVYYYAGVTDGETTVGIISSGINATIIALYPLAQNPVFSSKIDQYMVGFDDESYKYALQGIIENQGSGHGKNVTIRAVTKLMDPNLPPVADQLIPLGDIPEDYVADIEVTVRVPRANGLMTIYIEGDNFESYETKGFYFNFAR